MALVGAKVRKKTQVARWPTGFFAYLIDKDWRPSSAATKTLQVNPIRVNRF
jgi:hypothetical protein